MPAINGPWRWKAARYFSTRGLLKEKVDDVKNYLACPRRF